jgi:hypothetical protein
MLLGVEPLTKSDRNVVTHVEIYAVAFSSRGLSFSVEA